MILEQFFDFFLYIIRGLASWLLELPAFSGFSYGHALIAMMILSIIIRALIVRIPGASASQINSSMSARVAREKRNSRTGGSSGKGKEGN